MRLKFFYNSLLTQAYYQAYPTYETDEPLEKIELIAFDPFKKRKNPFEDGWNNSEEVGSRFEPFDLNVSSYKMELVKMMQLNNSFNLFLWEIFKLFSNFFQNRFSQYQDYDYDGEKLELAENEAKEIIEDENDYEDEGM